MRGNVVIQTDLSTGRINRNIYGHFAEHLGRCIYEGLWVGEDSSIPNTKGIRKDVLEALQKLNIPVLRWPGGCFADEYHWKDGVGPRESRRRMVNTHWGGVVESNHFGTHEFLFLCELLNCEPYICGNVGSGTVLEMQEWIEYMTFDGDTPMANWRKQNGREEPWRLTYFGVGNENWGCGGNMRPEYYADLYRRYQTYVRNFGDNRIYKIACGSNGSDYRWTEVLMREAGRFTDGLSLHHYSIGGPNWNEKGSATDFTEGEWFLVLKNALHMDELIRRHSAIMDQYDPDQRVGLIVDEWGTWYDVEPGTNPGFLYQQNTLRDALVAAVTFDIFHRYCNRVQMANIAQMVNVLQAMVLTEGAKILCTPTYHVFEMFKVHQNGEALAVNLQTPEYECGEEKIQQFSTSASKDDSGRIHLSLSNLHPQQAGDLSIALRGWKGVKPQVSGRILTSSEMNAHNTFASPENVRPRPFDDVQLSDEGLLVQLPPKSVVVLTLQQ